VHFVCDFTTDSLSDNNSKCWSIELVRQVFSEDIVVAILKTPLITQVPNDLECKEKWFVLCQKCVQAVC
jgi:hypothetical protein